MQHILDQINNVQFINHYNKKVFILYIYYIEYSEHPQTSNIIDLKCFKEYCVFLDNKNILHWTSE